MARDDKIMMRGTLVIAGGLIAFYGALAMLYAETIRSRSDFCPDASFILINSVCYTVWKILLPIFLLGIILLVVGIVAFRGKPDELEGHLHHGTGAHFTLSLLISLVAIPFLLWIIQTVREQGRDAFVVEFSNTLFEHTFLLELAILVGLIALLPFLGLYISVHVRRRSFLTAVAEATVEEDEVALPHEEGYLYDDAEPAEGEAMPEEEWPEGREDRGWEPEETPSGRPALEDRPGAEGQRAREAGEAASEDDAGWAPVEREETAEERPPEPPEEPAEPPSRGADRDPGARPTWMQPSGAYQEAPTQKVDEPEPEPQPEMEAEPAPQPEAQSPIVGCLHKDEDGTSCPNAVRAGSRYCEGHACHASTKAGKPCSNPSVEGQEFCRIHA